MEEFQKEWTGILLLMSPNKAYQPSKEKINTITSFLPILLKQNGTIFHIVLASFFITLFGVVSSYYFQAIIDFFVPNQTTSAKLLVHFCTPSEGAILYQQVNMQDMDPHFLREHVTYVPQESFFFYGTIIENLVFGLVDVPSFDQVIEVCSMVQLTEFINQQPLRFDTIIEEGGANLSGGQKQRLALAGALLKNAKILILDEATSGMDTLLEHAIMQNLKQLVDKTMIFIAHHLSIAKASDKVLVMHQGKLVEEETHTTLRNNGGMYQQLWEIDS